MSTGDFLKPSFYMISYDDFLKVFKVKSDFISEICTSKYLSIPYWVSHKKHPTFDLIYVENDCIYTICFYIF